MKQLVLPEITIPVFTSASMRYTINFRFEPGVVDADDPNPDGRWNMKFLLEHHGARDVDGGFSDTSLEWNYTFLLNFGLTPGAFLRELAQAYGEVNFYATLAVAWFDSAGNEVNSILIDSLDLSRLAYMPG